MLGTIAGIGAGLGTLGGLFSGGGGGIFGRPRIPKNPFQEETDANINRINTILGDLSGRSDQALSRSEMTTDQLYGDEIDRMRRSVSANAGASRRSATRSAMARGGDRAGTLAAGLLGVDEGANRTINDNMIRFTQLADRERGAARNRSDNLLSSVLGVEGNMLSRLDSRGDFERTMRIQRDQANRQFWLDLIGTAANTASSAASGGAG